MKYLVFVLLTAITLLSPASLWARKYRLEIAREKVWITGVPAEKITINGSIPGPTLRFTEGETVVIAVTNHLDEVSSVHWHGLLIPGEMDGVPGLNGFPGIQPGETFTYRFKIRQSGTYWYHSHNMPQEQEGHYGSIVIAPKGKKTVRADRDYVILLSDYSEEEAGRIMANLKMSSEYYQYSRRTIVDFFEDMFKKGFLKTWKEAMMWAKMRMMPTDLSDVTGYSFLTNGKTPQQNWTGIFKSGERLRLRFINGSAMSFFDVRIPGLKMQIVSADGQNVVPVLVDEFRFGAGETYDVIVVPKKNKAFSIVAESMDRTGFALGTLAPREGMKGEIPRHRPRTLLTMADMGSMGGMEHSNMKHGASSPMPTNKMKHDTSSAMPTNKMKHDTSSAMPTNKMKHDTSSAMPTNKMEQTNGWRAGAPPGNKVLDYTDLRYLGVQKDIRQPEREIIVKLGGNMERYIWTINGKKFAGSGPIQLKYNERIRLRFTNETMMAHPMHLHGMFVQLENGQPINRLPNKHTVTIRPGKSYSVLLTASESGEWAFHCHLMYHMMAGMMTTVVIAKPKTNSDTYSKQY